MQNFQEQYSSSRKVITGSFDDLQYIVYLGPNIHWTSNYGTGILGTALPVASF